RPERGVPVIGVRLTSLSPLVLLIACSTGRADVPWEHAPAVADDAEAAYRRGLAHAEKKEYDRAIAEFTEALRLDPKHAKAYFQRGLAHTDKGEYDEAVADTAEAIRIDPEDAHAVRTP